MKSPLKHLIILALFVILQGCTTIKEPRQIRLVVRNEPGKVIQGSAEFHLKNRVNGSTIGSGRTNDLGFAVIDRPKTVPFSQIDILVSYGQKTSSIVLNPFNDLYEVYLEPGSDNIPESERVADFHYHLSMKPHNTYGQYYYQGIRKAEIPNNLSWLRFSNKLRVYHSGKWKRLNLTGDIGNIEKRQLLQTYLENRWVRTKDGANNFKNFTQATLPHSFDGNVYLAFNAISPFEHSVSNDGVKRFVSSALKSGADINWLKIMGDKDHYLTHWENFNYEYAMIRSQDNGFNNFGWEFLEVNRSQPANFEKPIVVNVVEGGHIFQDKYFPHAINFDLMDSLSKEKMKLYETIKNRANDFKDTLMLRRIDSLEKILSSDKQYFRSIEDKNEKLRNDVKANEKSLKHRFVNDVLFQEIKSNIDSLKKLDIHMIAVSHLSYNGMVGHAPALDVSQKPLIEKVISVLAQRAYGIRVSNDKRYKKAYDGLFYRVPGVNAFGDTLITRLLDASKGRRIEIDFKHADVSSRRFLFRKYDELMERGDSIRPICSHCAVNGLPIEFSSPLVNEYRMLHSRLSRKFYPFSINLYNEEVRTICERNGIIGIPLEERVLGGYLNNRIEWPVTIRYKKKQYYAMDKPCLVKRSKYNEDVLRLMKQDKVHVFENVEKYYKASTSNTGKISDADIIQLICDDYFSAEPFLQNLFHIVDIANTVRRTNDENILVSRIKEKTIAVSNIQKRSMSNDSLSSAVSNYVKQLPDSIVSRSNKKDAWRNVCLGSDLDGLIDPINICPTASQYPYFKEKLTLLIPLFLYIRQNFEKRDKILGIHRGHEDYFDDNFSIQNALDLLFYTNLKEFTQNTF